MKPPFTSNASSATPGKKGRWMRFFHEVDELIWTVPDQTAHWLIRLAKRWMQIIDRSLRSFYNNDCFSTASSLTYTTLLTFVPLLALLLVGLKGFGFDEKAEAALKAHPVIQTLSITSIPAPHPGEIQSAETEPFITGLTGTKIIDSIFRFVDRTDLHNLGVIGFGGLFISVILLLAHVEAAMNNAWAVHRTRSFGRMITDYLGMVIALSLIIGALSATLSAQFLESAWARHWHLEEISQRFVKWLPYLLLFPALIVMYFFIPNTRVRWRSAVVAGIVAGSIYQIAQFGFIVFVSLLKDRYDKIYGTFAIIIMLIFYVYFSWSIILWGVEVCSAHQNLRVLRQRRRKWLGTPAERETLALRLAALLAVAPLSGEGRRHMDIGDMADALNLPPAPVGKTIDMFHAAGLIVGPAKDGTYELTQPPEQLTALDVLRLARTGDTRHKSELVECPLTPGGIDLLPQLQAPTIAELARLPIDQIQTFRV